MDSKSKTSKKRCRDRLREDFPIGSVKKRKQAKNVVRTLDEKKESQAVESQDITEFIAEHVVSPNTSLRINSDKNEQNLASHVRKTYGYGNKNMQLKREKLKYKGKYGKQNIKSEIPVNPMGCRLLAADNESLPMICSEEESVHQSRVSPENFEKNCSEETCRKNANPTSKMKNDESVLSVDNINVNTRNSHTRKVAVLSGDQCQFKIEGENVTLSTSLDGVQSSTLPHISPLPSNLPPTNTMGMPMMPLMPNISANTSAINSIPTPIVTYPLLPEMAPDAAKGAIFTVDIPTSYAKVDNPFTDIVTSGVPLEQTNHTTQNQPDSDVPYTSFANDDRIKTWKLNSGPDTAPEQNQACHTPDSQMVFKTDNSIPIVDIDEKTDVVLIEKNSSVASVTSWSEASPSEGEAVPPPAMVTSQDQDPLTTNSMKVDNWGSYLLQRLKLMFEHDQHCDLTLKFVTGEVLKVHRAVVLACTSLLLDSSPQDHQDEFPMPPELNYASVEPVIRFVYSGRLDIAGSQNEISDVYAAAQRLQVTLLTRLMGRCFPSLTPSQPPRARLPIWKKKADRLSRLHPLGKGTDNNNILPSSETPPSGQQKTSSTDPSIEDPAHLGEAIAKGSTQASGNVSISEEEMEEPGLDSSVYLLVTNSQKIAKANAAVRRKRPAEEARPTRFELEEDPDNPPVQIATWSSKNLSKNSSVPMFTASDQGQESIFTSVSSSVVASPNPVDVSSKKICISSSLSSTNVTGDSLADKACPQFQDPFSLLTHGMCSSQTSVGIDEVAPSNSENNSPNGRSNQEISNPGEDSVVDDDIGSDGDELMEKISNICRQLEEGDSDEEESNADEVYSMGECKMESLICEPSLPNECVKLSLTSSSKDTVCNDDCLVVNVSEKPVKSILRRKKDRNNVQKLKKQVSFPLDENNELINEVATYSQAKEPSQSLLDVQKITGSLKLSQDPSSPVKLTLSLKKKLLKNLSQSDHDTASQSSQDDEKIIDIDEGTMNNQSTSQGVPLTQGDMTNHAKIISEVLKKYPHLVKDKKNIRLKILKKGVDKSGNWPLVKSKVQYLVLSDNASKTKSNSKVSKSTSKSGTKGGGHSTTTARSVQSVQSGTSFDCPECDDLSSFPSYFTFKKHVNTNHKEKSSVILANIENVPYACYSCFLNEPLEFSDYFSYQQHMKDVHSKSEARLCSICGFRPGRKLELAYHQYTEHNKLPRNITFPKCDLCDHVAMNDAALLKHRSHHANADNYTCSVCGVAFRSFGALQGHMQTKLCHNKPSVSHKCPYCPQTFARSYNLKAHCKSNHRSAQISAQISVASGGEQQLGEEIKQEDCASQISTSSASVTVPSPSGSAEREQVEMSVGNVCETLTNANSQSSSEAEALSTVANSLAASLGLPEETVNHYMFPQGGKVDFPSGLVGEENLQRSGGMQLVETATSVPGYPGDLSLCHDGTFSSQSQLPTTTAVGTLYPVGVVPNQVTTSHMVSGQLVSSQMIPGGCVGVAGGSVLGAAPQSWTYVTYQVPNTSDDVPAVVAESSALAHTPMTPDHCAGVEVTVDAKSSENEVMNPCEEQNPLVVMTNTGTQVTISQASHEGTTQSYNGFSSQFV